MRISHFPFAFLVALPSALFLPHQVTAGQTLKKDIDRPVTVYFDYQSHQTPTHPLVITSFQKQHVSLLANQIVAAINDNLKKECPGTPTPRSVIRKKGKSGAVVAKRNLIEEASNESSSTCCEPPVLSICELELVSVESSMVSMNSTLSSWMKLNESMPLSMKKSIISNLMMIDQRAVDDPFSVTGIYLRVNQIVFESSMSMGFPLSDCLASLESKGRTSLYPAERSYIQSDEQLVACIREHAIHWDSTQSKRFIQLVRTQLKSNRLFLLKSIAPFLCPYRIKNLLREGTGGGGSWLVTLNRGGITFCAKIGKSSSLQVEKQTMQFVNSLARTSHQDHDLFVPLLDVIEFQVSSSEASNIKENGVNYTALIMPKYEESLKDVMESWSPIEEELIVQTILDTLAAIKILASKSVCHCDIKPGNLMLSSPAASSFGQSKRTTVRSPYSVTLIDFGSSVKYGDLLRESTPEMSFSLSDPSLSYDVNCLATTVAHLVMRKKKRYDSSTQLIQDICINSQTPYPIVCEIIQLFHIHDSEDDDLLSMDQFQAMIDSIHELYQQLNGKN